LTTVKVEGRAAATLPSTRLGPAHGFVQCIQAAASLSEDLNDQHTCRDIQVKIATLMHDRLRANRQGIEQQNNRRGEERRDLPRLRRTAARGPAFGRAPDGAPLPRPVRTRGGGGVEQKPSKDSPR
jgi:hypothetical protein